MTVSLSRPIVLVGLMGAGKTSVGKRLAERLHVPFRDSDHEIEAASGLEVREIFERFGEAYFRDGERKVIGRLLAGQPCILATGGGAFMSPDVRGDIGQMGVSVWIDASLDTLWGRVKDKPTRPLLQQPEPYKVLAGLLETRRPTYQLADISVRSDPDVPHEAMVDRILDAIHRFDTSHTDRQAVLIQDAE